MTPIALEPAFRKWYKGGLPGTVQTGTTIPAV